MSEWKVSSDLRKLRTESNLKTNASFDFAQSHLDFPSHSPYDIPPQPILLPEEECGSNVYFGDHNNHSTVSLQPIVTRAMAVELLTVAGMVRFLQAEHEERGRRLRGKQEAVEWLRRAVAGKEEEIEAQREHFERRRQAAAKRSDRTGAFRKERLRAVTEQTEQMQADIHCMLRGIRIKNKTRSFIDREPSFHEPRHTERKKIYIPIAPPTPPPQYYYPPSPNPGAQQFYPPNVTLNSLYSHTQQPAFLNKDNITRRSSLKINTQLPTAQKQPIIMEQLREALTLKFKQERQESSKDLGYFDKPLDTPSKSKLDTPSRGKQEERASETPKSTIRRSSSIKWRKDDHDDKELVEILQQSIKHIQTENDEAAPPAGSARQKKDAARKEETVKRAGLTVEVEGRAGGRPNSDSSQINITYDSEDKRNSKSFERQESNRRLSSKTSEKKSAPIDQSNVRIDVADMSASKNSNSSHSHSDKAHHSRYLPSLAKPFQEIEEEPEELPSLKLRNSLDRELKAASKNAKKQESPTPLQEEEEDEDILQSIKLDTESRFSRNLHGVTAMGEEEDDIIGGITLLKESRASREKSLKNSALQELVFEQREKGSQSEILNKEAEDDLFDSSLRLSTKSRIVKPGRPENEVALAKRGQTEPIKGQLTSIPSADYEEEEEEDTPPQSRSRPKPSSHRH